MRSEEDELADEIADRWVETHKKSMVTYIVLVLLAEKAMWSRELEAAFRDVTAWEITERGLHRVLQRMADLDLVNFVEAVSPKSGARRKVYAITEQGWRVVELINAKGMHYDMHPKYTERARQIVHPTS
jgi:DNA-binding PadR family transcriptional regulator